jgi:hypothetical protein
MLFRRKQEPERVLICAGESPLEIAERAVEKANERIAIVSREFRELQEQYQIRVDRDGRIAFAIVPDVSFREELETIVRENLRATDRALHDFHVALNVWAGLKGATNHGTSH